MNREIIKMDISDWDAEFKPLLNRELMEKYPEFYNVEMAIFTQQDDEEALFETWASEKERLIAVAKLIGGDNWQQHIWTMIDADMYEYANDDTSRVIIISGMAYINRINYRISKIPFDSNMHYNIAI